MPRTAARTTPLAQALLQQPLANEPLLPTPSNTHAFHLPADDLQACIAVQQWAQTHLGIPQLQLLQGALVLVPSEHCALQHSSTAAAAVGSTDSALAADLLSWRLRQVAAVRAAAGAHPTDATVVLTGGRRVRAGELCGRDLTDVQDFEVSEGNI